MSQHQHDFYKVNSLTDLDHASPVEGTIVWDAPRSLWNGAMLLGALVLGPLTLSWSALAVFLITAAITLCAGHSVGFHRRLIHRSFECPKWLERILVWLGTAVGMAPGTVLYAWAGSLLPSAEAIEQGEAAHGAVVWVLFAVALIAAAILGTAAARRLRKV